MKIHPNHTKQQLDAGKIAIGMGLHQSRTVDIGSIAKACETFDISTRFTLDGGRDTGL